MKKMRMIIILAVTAMMFGIMVSSVGADPIFITKPNIALIPYSAPYAKVEITWINNTQVTITATGLANADNQYLLGDGKSLALNVNATSFTTTNFIGTNPFPDFLPSSFTPAYRDVSSVSDFGVFNLHITDVDGWKNSVLSLTFTLTNTGSTWTSVDDVLVINSKGYLAAAHIFVGDTDPTRYETAMATGYAGNGTQVPEPTTLLLLGLGLIGIAGVGRKLKK